LRSTSRVSDQEAKEGKEEGGEEGRSDQSNDSNSSTSFSTSRDDGDGGARLERALIAARTHVEAV